MNLCAEPVRDEYLGSYTQWKCHLLQGRPTSSNNVQPQHGRNTYKIKNC